MTHWRRSWQEFWQDKPRRRREALFLIIVLVGIVICLLPLRHAGWPQDHEGLAFIDRTSIYADHIRHGDFFPIWSSSDAFGMGTPLPLFYHKTFYFLSGFIYLITGAIKFTIVVTIALFMLVGVYGLRACLRVIKNQNPWVEFIAPLAFLLANYTFTDWLIRGAMAEFSAMMIIPWLIWWCLNLLVAKRFSWWIAPIFFFLFNAHNVSALYGGLLLLLAGIIFLSTERLNGLKLIWKKALLTSVLLLVLMLPQLVLQHAFLKDYNPGKITEAGFKASQNFHLPSQYFVNSDYVWLQDWRTYNVQLDYGIWLVLAIMISGLIIYVTLSRGKQRWGWLNPTVIFLAIAFALMLLLQFKIARSFYERIPLMEYLQFPWRLLAFLTPLGILLVVLPFRRVGKRWSKILLAGWLGLFLLLSPLTHHFSYDFIPADYIQAVVKPSPGGLGGQITGIGEYLPIVTKDGQELSSLKTLALYQEYYAKNSQSQVLKGDCRVENLPRANFDPNVVWLNVSCATPAKVALPLTYNGYSEIIIKNSSEQHLKYSRQADDPRMIVNLPAGQNQQLEIKLPTAFRVATKLL